jgi:hypothetical protein
MLEMRTFQNQLTEARNLNSTHKEQLCSVNNQLLQTQSVRLNVTIVCVLGHMFD